MTEKEAVSRRQYAKLQKIKDKSKKSLPWSTCIKNIYTHLTRKNPESVLDIANRMNVNNSFDIGRDRDITGDENIKPEMPSSSSSSSSYDELPSSLMPNPLNVIYGKNPNVMIVGADGQVLQHVPHDEFIKENPGYSNTQHPSTVGNAEDSERAFVAQNTVNPPNVKVYLEDKGEFSEKYKAKMEEEKQRKYEEDTIEDRVQASNSDNKSDSNSDTNPGVNSESSSDTQEVEVL
jgi:hypothetical protein